MKPLDTVLDRLEAVEPRPSGTYQARCPTHEDRQPSLSISERSDGTVAMFCHAGCRTRDILDTAGLTWADLYPSSTNGHRRNAPQRRRAWQIKSADGDLVAVHRRQDAEDGKRLWWTRPGGKGLGGMPVSALPLYRSEETANWPDDMSVIVVEGEPAADALAEVYPATVATVTGAEGRPGSEALGVLRRRSVVLWCDSDEPGRKHMRRIATELRGIAAEVRIFEPPGMPEKGDAADHPAVKSGSRNAVTELLKAMASTPTWKPESYRNGVTNPIYGEYAVTLTRLRDVPPPGPMRYVVKGIVPMGFATMLYGDGGVAKSMLAMSLATAISGGASRWLGNEIENCPAVYADFELDVQEQRRRAGRLAHGCHMEDCPEDLYYVSAAGETARRFLPSLLGVCVENGIGFVVLDSLGMALQGDPNSSSDVVAFHKRYLDPFRKAGVTVLIIDHQAKTGVGERYQGKRAFGSVYKENCARSVLQVEPHARGAGLLRIKLRQTKVNFGEMIASFGIQLDFSDEAVRVERYALEAEELAKERSLNLREKILLTLTSGPAFAKEISDSIDTEYQSVKNAVSQLRRDGLIEDTGKVNGQSRQVHLTDTGTRVAQRNGVTNHIGDEYAITLGNGQGGAHDDPLEGNVVNGVFRPKSERWDGQGAQDFQIRDRENCDDDDDGDYHRHPLDCECIQCL